MKDSTVQLQTLWSFSFSRSIGFSTPSQLGLGPFSSISPMLEGSSDDDSM